MEHALKTWPEHFSAVKRGAKRAELRKDDKQPPFCVGDNLVLQEWEPTRQLFTGRVVVRRVTHVARGGVIPEGYALLSIGSRWWS